MTAGTVIVGAGQAGFQVAASLAKAPGGGPVTLLGDEPHLPYQRPPLSKELLISEDERGAALARLRPAEFYPNNAIALIGGDRAVAIDRDRRSVTLGSGRVLGYDQLVLATGARPRTLPVAGAQLEGVVGLRSLDDALALRRRLRAAASVVVIGGGFIGLEVASATRTLGVATTVVEAVDRVLARVVSPPISAHLAALHAEAGTTLLHGARVERITGDDRGRVTGVALEGGAVLAADVVVLGVGVVPETALAAEAGIAVDDGVLVDGGLRTADPAIWAAGDCARFTTADGRTLRLESVQNATDHGRCVAAAIAGAPAAYDAVPWFWSTQLGARLQIAGVAEAGDVAVVRDEAGHTGLSVWRFRDGRLTAVESIDRPDHHVVARRLLARPGRVAPEHVADPAADLRALAAS